MHDHYTHLGVVPAIADRSVERRDAILAQMGPTARAMLAEVKKLPRDQRVAALDEALRAFDRELPARVHRVAEHLHREGMKVDQAVERALALSLADASIERFKKVGAAYRSGTVYPVGGFGLSGSAADTTRNLAEQAFRKISCSNQIQRATTNLVGRNEGYDAARNTEIGFNVARSLSQCDGGAAAPAAPPPPPPEPEKRSMVWPVVGAVAVVGLVGGFVLLRRK